MKGMMPPGFQRGGKKSKAPGMEPMEMSNAPKGRPGARKGMPNFKARITKPGGMAKGGAVGGQGSGSSRLNRSK